MAQELDYSDFDALPEEVDYSDFDALPEEQSSQNNQLDVKVNADTNNDLKATPGLEQNLFFANIMKGISNSITFDPESNFETVKSLIPKAELRSGEIFVPDQDKKTMVPLSQAGGEIGQYAEALSSSFRPIVGMIASTPGLLAGMKTGATLGAAGGPVGAGAGAALGGLGGMALTSLLGTTAYDAAMTTVGGVKDKRTALESLGMAAEEFAVDIVGGKLFETLPKAVKSIVTSPFRAGEWAVNFLSKYGLAPKTEQISVANAMNYFSSRSGKNSVKEMLNIMEENNVSYPLALELMSSNKVIRSIINKTMETPFGGTLHKEIESAIANTQAGAFKASKGFKEGPLLSLEKAGDFVESNLKKVYDKRQNIQSKLRENFQIDLKNTLSRSPSKDDNIQVLDLLEKNRGNVTDFSATSLSENPSYRKIESFFKKKIASEKTSQIAGVPENSFYSTIMDLDIPGDQAKKIIYESTKSATIDSSNGIKINDLFEIEKAARSAYSSRYMNLGGQVDELGLKLKSFRDQVSEKINTEIERISPKLLTQKLNYDAQWKKDTEMIEGGIAKFKQHFRNPEEIVNIAKSQSKIGSTRLKNIRDAFKGTRKEVWDELRGTIVDTMGKSGKGDLNFSLQKWASDYSSFSPEAKNVLFGDVPGLIKSLDEFKEVSFLAKKRHLEKSPGLSIKGSLLQAAIDSLILGPSKYIGGASGNFITSRMMSSPKFVTVISDSVDPKNIRIVTEGGMRKKKYFDKKILNRFVGIAGSNILLRDDINKFIGHLQDKVLYKMTEESLKSK